MVKRLLSANASDILNFTSAELKQSIKANEGRTVVSENVVLREPVVGDITNAEVARAFGADLILLNGFDVLNPVVLGMYGQTTMADAEPNPEVVRDLRKLVGRPVGTNLEPVDLSAEMLENQQNIAVGRQASESTFKAAQELGLDFIVLTGNPGTGVTNAEIVKAIRLAKEHFNGLVVAGKMHGAGVNEPVVSTQAVREFVEAGADIIIVPALGTVWGVGEAELREAVLVAHEAGALVMSAIGTSQETSDPATIRDFAIQNKILGVDLQHIGDAGIGGLAPVENIFTMSKAIRGERHTVSMIARSILR